MGIGEEDIMAAMGVVEGEGFTITIASGGIEVCFIFFFSTPRSSCARWFSNSVR